MKTQPLTISLLIVILAAMPVFGGAVTGTNATDSPLPEPVKSIYDHYLKIQSTLADDSTKDVSEHARAIAKSVVDHPTNSLPAAVAAQATAVAEAKDIAAARKAFKPLSDSLIKYLADRKLGSGTYREIYCPMEEASWLQTGKDIKNPYVGESMPGCGIPKRTF